MKTKSILALILLAALLLPSAVAAAEAPVAPEAVPCSTLVSAEIPLYCGEDSVTIGDNVPDFYLSQLTRDCYVHFSPLDELGRTGPAMACLGPETLPAEGREQTGDIKPSGWHTQRYDELIEDKYLYNRSHVIGYLLAGNHVQPENFFTGTRYLNAGSMLRYEIEIANYIEESGNHVLYRVSPQYLGDDLLATGVQLEACSVEDRGEGVCLNVFLYNVQPGIVIDYATGESRAAEGEEAAALFTLTVSGEEQSAPESRALPEAEETVAPVVTYILNTNSHVFHSPNCSSVDEMKEKNRQEFYGSREEAIEAGYKPCGRCHP